MALIQSSAVTKTLAGANNAPALSGVAAGNLLILTVTWAQQTNANPPTVAGWSTAENPTGTAFAGGIAWVGTAIFYLENATAGRAEPIVIPAAGSTSCVLTTQVSEFPSGLTSGALDKHTNARGTASTSGGTGTPFTLR